MGFFVSRLFLIISHTLLVGVGYRCAKQLVTRMQKRMLVPQQIPVLTAASVAVISLPSLNHLMKTPAVVLYVGKESLREKLNGCNAQSMLGSFTASMLNLFMRLATFWGTNQFGGNKNGRLSHLCMLQVVNNPLRCNNNWNFSHLMLKFEIGQNTEANVQLI